MGKNKSSVKMLGQGRMGSARTQRRGIKLPCDGRAIDKTLLENKTKQSKNWSLTSKIMAPEMSLSPAESMQPQ